MFSLVCCDLPFKRSSDATTTPIVMESKPSLPDIMSRSNLLSAQVSLERHLDTSLKYSLSDVTGERGVDWQIIKPILLNSQNNRAIAF